jgi:photosystem II stability/assembly factor-like uncharacterized protein
MSCAGPPTHGAASCGGATCSITCDAYYARSGNACVPAWTKETSGTTQTLTGIWGSGPNDIYVVGQTVILHSTGNGSWTVSYALPASNTVNTFNSIWGDRNHTSHVYVAGDLGTIFHTANGGSTWTNESPGILGNFRAVTGAAYNLAFTLGNKVYTQMGSGWTPIAQTISPYFSCAAALGFGNYVWAGAYDGKIYHTDINGVFSLDYDPGWPSVSGLVLGTNADMFAVGPAGRIVHGSVCAGSCTETWGTPAQTSNTTQDLQGVGFVVDGANTPTYYAVGANGTILRSSGNGSWAAQTSNTTAALYAVWGSSPADIYAVGANGTIMHIKGP